MLVHTRARRARLSRMRSLWIRLVAAPCAVRDVRDLHRCHSLSTSAKSKSLSDRHLLLCMQAHTHVLAQVVDRVCVNKASVATNARHTTCEASRTDWSMRDHLSRRQPCTVLSNSRLQSCASTCRALRLSTSLMRARQLPARVLNAMRTMSLGRDALRLKQARTWLLRTAPWSPRTTKVSRSKSYRPSLFLVDLRRSDFAIRSRSLRAIEVAGTSHAVRARVYTRR